MTIYSGKFITFEGGEGTGKTTQIKMLKSYLEEKKYSVMTSREPGGTEISETIRTLLKDPKYKRIMSKRAELMLFEAARCQITKQILKPLLKKGKIIIFDRFYDSTTVYQGYGRRIGMNLIKQLNDFATEGIRPDLTFLLDVSPETGLQRSVKTEFGGKVDRMEAEGIPFHRKIRAGYLKVAESYPERFKVIDTEKNNIEQVHKIICGYVDNLLSKNP